MEKIKALIVEDNMLTAKDIAGCLETEGFEVIAMADNGEDATGKDNTTSPLNTNLFFHITLFIFLLPVF